MLSHGISYFFGIYVVHKYCLLILINASPSLDLITKKKIMKYVYISIEIYQLSFTAVKRKRSLDLTENFHAASVGLTISYAAGYFL